MAITDRLRQRAGGLVLPIVLLAGVFTATLGAGYSATQTKLGDAIGHLIRGTSIAVVNPESNTVEAEAPTTATGTQDVEVTPTPGGNIATSNHKTGEVQIRDAGTLKPKGSPIANEGDPLLLAAGSVTYVLDPEADTIRQLGEDGQVVSEVKVPGATRTAVPDGGNGVWVLTQDGKVSHVVQGRAERTLDLPDRVTTLTTAGVPVAITSSGKALDISVNPPNPIQQEPVPGDQDVLPGSHKGSGRYVLLLNPTAGRLVAIDTQSDVRHEFKELPKNHSLGQPVQLGHLLFVPDYGTPHKLYVFDMATRSPRPEITVPGLHTRFELKVQNGRVWADDQFDQQSVVIGANGGKEYLDKGPGDGVLTNTNDPSWSPDKPVKPEPPAKPETTPPPTVPPTKPTKPPTTSPPPQTTPPAPPTQTPPPTRTGPITPPVVGMLVGAGCTSVQRQTLTCDRQPLPGPSTLADLGVIVEQSPQRDTRVDPGSSVAVRYHANGTMPDVTGQDAAKACRDFVDVTRNQVKCRVTEGTGTGTPQTVQSQSPAAGQPVDLDGEIVLTHYPTPAPIPTVPDVRNKPRAEACLMLQNSGYQCVEVADRIARDANVVLDQNPPPGTPQQNGSVQVHHAQYQPVRLARLVSTDPGNPEVHILRFENQSAPGYRHDTWLGWAYPPQGGPHFPAYYRVNGYMCSASASTCGGRSPNHYYSLDDSTPLASWVPTQPVAWTLASNGAQGCSDGQTAISRFGRISGSSRVYTVAPAGTAGWTHIEHLGCVWNP